MAKVYLHIGTAKTGTTALQRFFAKNRELLEQQGIIYPDTGIYYENVENNRNAHFLVGERFDSSWNHLREQEEREFEQGLDFLKEIGENHSTILLSDESLWYRGGVNPELWEKLKKGFDQRGLEVKIIVYFRRQDSFVESHWAQQVRGGATLSFYEYIHSDSFKEYPLNYYEHLSVIAESFGKENIIVRPFESQQYQGEEKTIYSDFLNILGLELSSGFEVARPYQNMKLKGHYLEILRMLNNFRGLSDNKIITSVLKDVQGRKINDFNYRETTQFSSVEERKEFLEQFAEGNEKIAREYLGKASGKLFWYRVKDTPQFKVDDKVLLQDTILVYGKILDRTHRIYDKQYEEMSKEIADLKKQVNSLMKEKEGNNLSLKHRMKRKIKALAGK